MENEIQKRLKSIAFKRTIPFCYGCYREAPSGRCITCGSDDLMRLLPGEGCEYGTEWVVKAILSSELTLVDTDEAFEESVRQCYPETTQIGWMTLDTVQVLKEMDPISWDLAKSEWESAESDEGNLISPDNGVTYYWLADVESLLDSD